jgi:hypothetical protein
MHCTPPERTTRRRLGNSLVAVGIVADALVAGGWRPFTRPAEVTTFASGIAILMLAVAIRPARSGPLPATDQALSAWTLWIAAAAAWELAALSAHPRTAHPTLSSLLNVLVEDRPGRTCGVLAWLGLGWWLTRR